MYSGPWLLDQEFRRMRTAATGGRPLLCLPKQLSCRPECVLVQSCDMYVDTHCHVGLPNFTCRDAERFSFEPMDGPAADSHLSSLLLRIISSWPIRSLIGIPALKPASEAAARIEQWLLEHLLQAQRVDRAVVLAFDRAHDEQGRPIRARHHAPLYASNTYARYLARQHPGRILFGASIHPYRTHEGRSAVQLLDEVVAAGAVLVKWLPPTQNINPANQHTIGFMRRCAELRVPLLIHLGPEHVLGNRYGRWGQSWRWLRVFRQLRSEGAMPTTIIAHAATPSMWPIAYARSHRDLVRGLLGEFSDAPLYADLAGMAVFSKARWMRRTLRNPTLRAKLVQASDFPVPQTPWAFCPPFTAASRRVRQTRSWLDRDVLLKSYAGVDDAIFSRGAELLAERIDCADRVMNPDTKSR